MKKLKLNQCNTGCYNFLDDKQKSVQFSASIVGEDNKIIERNGIKCLLHVSSSEDPDYLCERLVQAFKEGDIETLTDESAKNAGRWFGTTDYRAQTLAFAAEFRDSYVEIAERFQAEHYMEIKVKIEKLQKELESCGLYSEPDEVIKAAEKCIPKSSKVWEKELNDLKPESERAKTLTKRIFDDKEQEEKYKAIIA